MLYHWRGTRLKGWLYLFLLLERLRRWRLFNHLRFRFGLRLLQRNSCCRHSLGRLKQGQIQGKRPVLLNGRYFLLPRQGKRRHDRCM
jgi:hypothetical protein